MNRHFGMQFLTHVHGVKIYMYRIVVEEMILNVLNKNRFGSPVNYEIDDGAFSGLLECLQKVLFINFNLLVFGIMAIQNSRKLAYLAKAFSFLSGSGSF